VSGVELLMDFIEGVLPSDVSAALEAHVAGCARCAAFVASYQATPRILRDATAVTLPADIEVSLKAFLRARTDAFK
jgi:anti-sigma factor RsiW